MAAHPFSVGNALRLVEDAHSFDEQILVDRHPQVPPLRITAKASLFFGMSVLAVVDESLLRDVGARG
jgi:hypothetical protein